MLRFYIYIYVPDLFLRFPTTIRYAKLCLRTFYLQLGECRVVDGRSALSVLGGVCLFLLLLLLFIFKAKLC